MPKEYYLLLGAIIAAVFSVITTLLNNRMANWKDKKELKRNHNYEQLKELYLELYGVVIQSEYLRYFLKEYQGLDLSPLEVPFIELEETYNGQRVENPITDFNKSKIIKTIIEKKQFASPELLKLAISYRYVHHHYLKKIEEQGLRDHHQLEEIKLIRKIVVTIIKECNQLLEECQMNYNGKELSYGIMDLSVFEKDIDLN